MVQKLIFFKSVTSFWFTYISALWYCPEKFLYFRRSYGSDFSSELCSSLLSCLYPEKLSQNCCASLVRFFFYPLFICGNKNIFGQKKFGSKENIGYKKICSTKMFGFKKKCWPRNILVWKWCYCWKIIFGSEKLLGLKKNMGPKKFWAPKKITLK